MNAKTTLNIFVCGANGRMGKEIINLIVKDPDLYLAGATEHPDCPVLGADAGLNAGTRQVSVSLTLDLKRAVEKYRYGVVIDFSSPDSTLDNLKRAVDFSVPVVIGTTGFKDEGMAAIRDVAKRIPLLMAPNMSIGMNIMLRLASEAGRFLKDGFDIEITEFHHRDKKDAPSGSAMKLAEVVCAQTGKKFPEALRHDRFGIAPRKEGELGMQVLRGGDVVGEHAVLFCGAGERLEIRHIATNRATFAAGALKAAKWLNGKPAGLYGMEDVLNTK